MQITQSADGTAIAYDATGSGPPVVLVGGALNDRASAEPLAALLAPHLRVHTFDRRGRGDSGDTAPWAVEREVEDLAAVLAAAGGEAAVFGMSSGGLLSLTAAAAGLPMTRVAVYEPPWRSDAARFAAFAALQRDRVTGGRRDEAVADFFDITGVPARMVSIIRRSPAWPGLVDLAHTLPHDSALVSTTLDLDLSGVAVPVLVVDGGGSPEIMREAADTAAAAVPGARRLTLPGQVHNVDPQVLAPHLLEFFAG